MAGQTVFLAVGVGGVARHTRGYRGCRLELAGEGAICKVIQHLYCKSGDVGSQTAATGFTFVGGAHNVGLGHELGHGNVAQNRIGHCRRVLNFGLVNRELTLLIPGEEFVGQHRGVCCVMAEIDDMGGRRQCATQGSPAIETAGTISKSLSGDLGVRISYFILKQADDAIGYTVASTTLHVSGIGTLGDGVDIELSPFERPLEYLRLHRRSGRCGGIGLFGCTSGQYGTKSAGGQSCTGNCQATLGDELAPVKGFLF